MNVKIELEPAEVTKPLKSLKYRREATTAPTAEMEMVAMRTGAHRSV